MKYGAVVFDLDGTLLDTIGDIANAANRALAARNIPGYSKDEYRIMVGHGLKHLIRTALKEFDPSLEADEDLYLQTMEEYRRSPYRDTSFYPGIPEMLDSLTRMGVKMSILSNKEDSLVQIITDKLLKDWSFTVIQGRMDSYPAKPDPAALLKIIGTMEEIPERTMYVGDSEVDVKTGRNAGVFSAGAAWGYREAELLEKEGADFVAGTPEALIELFS